MACTGQHATTVVENGPRLDKKLSSKFFNFEVHWGEVTFVAVACIPEREMQNFSLGLWRVPLA